MNDITNWWQSISSFAQVFWVIGLVSNLLLIVYYATSFLGHDVDAPDSPDFDGDFSILSIRSILAFGTFMSWTVVLFLRSGAAPWMALVAGIAAGGMAAWLAWRMIRILLKMQSSGANMKINELVGRIGTVYFPIPAAGEKTGKITLTVQHAFREFEVVSLESEILPTGMKVLVTSIRDDGVPIVVPYTENETDMHLPLDELKNTDNNYLASFEARKNASD